MEALFIIICRYPLRFSSKITVNGPSFSRDTFISAPKIPCSTTGTCLLASEIIYSYNLFASSGAPASMKLGRFPLRQFAYKVNCETKSNSPFTSARYKLVFPFSSSKIRSPRSFFKYQSASSLVSPRPTPIRTRNPFPIFPTVSPSTLTYA